MHGRGTDSEYLKKGITSGYRAGSGATGGAGRPDQESGPLARAGSACGASPGPVALVEGTRGITTTNVATRLRRGDRARQSGLWLRVFKPQYVVVLLPPVFNARIRPCCTAIPQAPDTLPDPILMGLVGLRFSLLLDNSVLRGLTAMVAVAYSADILANLLARFQISPWSASSCCWVWYCCWLAPG